MRALNFFIIFPEISQGWQMYCFVLLGSINMNWRVLLIMQEGEIELLRQPSRCLMYCISVLSIVPLKK